MRTVGNLLGPEAVEGRARGLEKAFVFVPRDENTERLWRNVAGPPAAQERSVTRGFTGARTASGTVAA